MQPKQFNIFQQLRIETIRQLNHSETINNLILCEQLAETMLVSLEALAMAGVSDVEFGMDIEEWERKDLEQYPPPHLLAEEEEKEGNNEVRRLKKGHVYGFPTTHFLPNQKAWEYDKEEDGVTFINIQEKLDRNVETIWSQCRRSMRIMARALETLIMILCCCKHKRFRF